MQDYIQRKENFLKEVLNFAEVQIRVSFYADREVYQLNYRDEWEESIYDNTITELNEFEFNRKLNSLPPRQIREAGYINKQLNKILGAEKFIQNEALLGIISTVLTASTGMMNLLEHHDKNQADEIQF